MVFCHSVGKTIRQHTLYFARQKTKRLDAQQDNPKSKRKFAYQPFAKTRVGKAESLAKTELSYGNNPLLYNNTTFLESEIVSFSILIIATPLYDVFNSIVVPLLM